MIRCTHFLVAGAIAALVLFGPSQLAFGETMHSISVDGVFSDWDTVPSHYDPISGPDVYDNGIHDTHATDDLGPSGHPGYVAHPDVDLVEYKFTHDENNLYAYFRATGVIVSKGNPRLTTLRQPVAYWTAAVPPVPPW